jgi:hypothetical protein
VSTNVELYGDIREQATAYIVEQALAVMKASMGPDGESFGDRDMERRDRIMRFLEDAQTGALDVLRNISPDIYQKYVAQYQRDMAAVLGGA